MILVIFRKLFVQVIDINLRGGGADEKFISITNTNYFLNVLYHGPIRNISFSFQTFIASCDIMMNDRIMCCNPLSTFHD